MAIQVRCMDLSMITRLKELEAENNRLKKMYADNQRRWHQSLNFKEPAEVYLKKETKACNLNSGLIS
jgi:hypothetical protein